jgi:hypothetical protein
MPASEEAPEIAEIAPLAMKGRSGKAEKSGFHPIFEEIHEELF